MGVRQRFRQAVVLAALGAVFSGGCGRTSRNARPDATADGGARTDGAAGSATTDEPNCAVSLSANAGRHCAVYQDGSVWCWGTQDQPAPADFKATSEPVRVPGVEHAVRIEVGPRHSCALTVAGSLVCWGDNESKQIDDSGTTPVRPTSPGFSNFAPAPLKGFGLADTQTCIVNLLSHVYCRGGASSAQRQIEVAADAGATMPGSGPDVIDGHGQIFDITTWNKPRPLLAFGADNAWIGINARESCVLKRWGSLWCTEFRHEGLENVVVHGELLLGEHVVRAGTGSSFVCAITDADRVWCAGDNDVGQAATGDQARANGGFVDGLKDTYTLAVNDRSACALEADGSVWCWGAFADGLESDVPTQVSGCSRQTAVAPKPFMGAVRDSAQHLAESGRALSQAKCACSGGVLTEACVASGDLSPNPSCLDALAAGQSSSFWNDRASAQWAQAVCLAALPCQDATDAACPPPPSGDVTMSPPVDGYCKRRTCALDQEVNLSQRQICDGVVDCSDGSDERNCQPDEQSFHCAAVDETIDLIRVCDGVPDCLDGSDEEYCE